MMYGVVLWSDTEDQKAVIWCEDHGDLAFYRQPQDGDQVALDAGDWVQFDLTTERQVRFAHNPRLVAEGLYPGLADALSGAGEAPETNGLPRSRVAHGSADIIPFAPRTSGGAAGRDSMVVTHV